jgi:hypothetical protein
MGQTKPTSKAATPKKVRKKVLVTFRDDEVDLFASYKKERAIAFPDGLVVREMAVERMNEFFKQKQEAA